MAYPRNDMTQDPAEQDPHLPVYEIHVSVFGQKQCHLLANSVSQVQVAKFHENVHE